MYILNLVYWTQGEVKENYLTKTIIVLDFYVAHVAILLILWNSR
jgi:hypothetical protein